MFKKKIKENGCLDIELLNMDYGSWEDFEGIAHHIEQTFQVDILEKHDAIMNREWVFSVEKKKVALYYQDMNGIFLYAKDDPTANKVVEDIALSLEKDWKSKGVWQIIGYQ